MKMTRRDALTTTCAAAAAWLAGVLPTRAAEDGDWKGAFRTLGFDPAAPGCGVFVVSGDVHAPERSDAFAENVRFWNAMDPAPAFAVLLGDNLCANSSFGHTPRNDREWAKADSQPPVLRELIRPLRVPLKMVIGNHDTFVGEKDAAWFRKSFPEVPAYETFEALGIRFVKWNGGHDGSIDADQEAWIQKVVSETPPEQTLVVLVHQPSIGMVERERDIARVSRKVFASRTGETWLLGGHEHYNALKRFELPKTAYGVAVHALNHDGHWIYGVREGRIVARVWRATGKAPVPDKLPWKLKSMGPIKLAFEGRNDVLWATFVGSAEERTQYRVSATKSPDTGTWFFYVGELVHRLPRAASAPVSTHVGILGNFPGHRKTKEREHILLSADGRDWVEVPRLDVVDRVHRYEIPAALRTGTDLWVKVVGFGYGADMSVGGFALLA